MAGPARTAVVTGGGSGIGEACARRLAADGFGIAVLDVNPDGAGRVAEAIRADGGDATAYPCDVTDPASLADLAARIDDERPPVEALVTAAGVLNNASTLMEMDVREHDRVWQVNYHGTVHTIRAFVPAMQRRGRGAVVTLGSTNCFGPFPLPAYNPSKHAIKGLTELLAVECGHSGLRVNSVAPGYTMSPAMLARIEAGERDPEAIKRTCALDMLIEPRHVAAAVAFLCSEDAAAITGVMLPVDAGHLVGVHYKSYAGGVPWER